MNHLHNSKKFYLDNKGNIYYKKNNINILIKISPLSENENKRVFPYEISNKQLKQISRLKAMQMVNQQFYKCDETWIYQNNIYKVLCGNEKNATFDIIRGKEHVFKQIYLDVNHNQHIFQQTFYICWFRGNIFWLQLGQYFPRVKLYKFYSIKTPPIANDFIQWTSAKNCKIIYLGNERI